MSGPASSEAFAANKKKRSTQIQFKTTTFRLCLTPVTLPLIVVCNLFDASMVVVRVPRKEAGVLLVRHEQADPHHQVHSYEGVVGPPQDVPGHRHALQPQLSQSGMI